MLALHLESLGLCDADILACGLSRPLRAPWFREAGGMPPLALAPYSGRYLLFSEHEGFALLRAQDLGFGESAAAWPVALGHFTRTVPGCSGP